MIPHLTHGPFLGLILPMLDIADLPPVPTPPMPVGASRIETHAGWYLAGDTGFEVEGGLVGAGYIVRRSDGTNQKRGTLAARVAGTWFTPGESEMPVDRYWVGPFVRAEAASEIFGRHDGPEFGQVNRAAADLGYRYPLGGSVGSAGSLGIGYAVAHDRQGVVYQGIKHGLRLQVDFVLR